MCKGKVFAESRNLMGFTKNPLSRQLLELIKLSLGSIKLRGGESLSSAECCQAGNLGLAFMVTVQCSMESWGGTKGNEDSGLYGNSS